MSPDESTTLLTYELTTTPDPPRASNPAGSTAHLKLTVIGNLNSGEAVVERVRIHFDVGDAASADASYLTCDATGMNAEGSPTNAWTLTSSQDGTFLFSRPVGTDPSVDVQGYTFEIDNIAVSSVVGTAVVTIGEFGRLVGDQQSVWRNTSFEIPKFPHDFDEVHFEVDPPVVQRGKRATLSWTGDASANYHLSVNGSKPQYVTDESPLPSDPLEEDTSFVLIVSCGSGGAQVTQTYSQIVLIREPQVTSFLAHPDAIDYKQEVLLTWTTNDADRTELRVGPQGETRHLDPASHVDSPTTIIPEPGSTYTLVPYQGDASGPPRLLTFNFNPLRVNFGAEPSSLVVPVNPNWALWAGRHGDVMPTFIDPPQQTTVSYDVVNAHAIKFAGVTTEATGSRLSGSVVEHPFADTTYTLIVNRLDRVRVEATAAVKLRRFDVAFAQSAGSVTVTLSLNHLDELMVLVRNAHLCFSRDSHYWSRSSDHRETPMTLAELTLHDQTWVGVLNFSVSSDWLQYPNAALMFDYIVQGEKGSISVTQDMAYWRGSFDFAGNDDD